ncbi:hypothetical protein FQR65_LT05023 [Abscondita terminalis]|nr:hypothetical protein FQR65_LT05023 [Abscondita terminalis]
MFLIFGCDAQKSQIDRLNFFENVLSVSGNFEIPSYETRNRGRGQFDYVVVGGGTAGAVLASRLSENTNMRVLLLEAGDSPPRVSEVPLLTTYLQLTKYNWNYVLEKQENFGLGMVDGRIHWPRGKGLGGSSVINSMVYTRGNKHDYDRWAAMGNPGWSYQDVLPYFYERVLKHRRRLSDKAGRVFIQAAMEFGYPYVDYNGENQLGVSTAQLTLRNGRRCSTEKAFLRPARRRNNLVVLKNSFVTRVLIDETTKTAYGVEYTRNKKSFSVRARKEVILSAGVLGSPKILMLSGIGPRYHLKEMNIPLIQDLPVGKKIYDHPMYLGLIFSASEELTSSTKQVTVDAFLNFTTAGGGILTSPEGIEALLFTKTNAANYEGNYPDIEFMFVGSNFHTNPNLAFNYALNLNDDTGVSVWGNLTDYTMTIFILLLHPKSYGYLKLRSVDPLEKLKIHANYFTDSENQDMRTMMAAIREAQKITKASQFQKYEIKQIKNVVSGCEHLIYDSDDYWDCAVRHVTNTVHHQTTTCKMGPSHDPEAVVDDKLRVHGIKNLRVVDTSVIPIPLSGHTNAPTIMLAEKASDIILQDYTNEC